MHLGPRVETALDEQQSMIMADRSIRTCHDYRLLHYQVIYLPFARQGKLQLPVCASLLAHVYLSAVADRIDLVMIARES
jgi:hypothetical protein